MCVRDEHTHPIQPHHLGCDLRRDPGCPPESDVEAAVDQHSTLLGHTGLNAVNLQTGMPRLHRPQHLRHRIETRIAHGYAKHRSGRGRRSGRCLGPLKVVQDLADVEEEHHAGVGEANVVGAALHQWHPQFTFEPLDLLTQRRLHDVLTRRGATEMQLLGQAREVPQLPQFHL